MKTTTLFLAHLLTRRAWLWTGFLAFATIAFGPPPAHAALTEAWVQRYGSEAGSEDRAYKVVTDAGGNVIVAGTTWHNQTGSGSDMLIIKYSGAGVPLWTNRYDGPANGYDQATALAVDASGNVFVTGYSAGSGGNEDYATIAYSGAGVPLWTNRYDGDQATALAVDASGNVFVTGSSQGSGFDRDYATIAYSGAGVSLWTNRYNGPANSDDLPTALAVDASGNVFVTGHSGYLGGFDWIYDYATIAYSGAGVPLWTNRYNGPGNGNDLANALAVDASGNVFVTGSSVGSGGNAEYATIGYSGAGVPLWTKRYNGPGNGWGLATAVAVDGSGNVFVTGSSYGSEASYDYATIAYSGAGMPLWTNRYDGPGDSDDRAGALAVDDSGNVFVTGYSYGIPGYVDYATIAYSGAGVPLWTNRYPGPGILQANALAVDGGGNVFVTGSSIGVRGDHDYATIAYSGAGVALWTNRYGGRANSDDRATAVAVDGSGNVFVTGYSYGTPGYADYATIAYSGAGVPLWTNRYSGLGNGRELATALAVDASGNVFVTGSSATIAYSGAGVPLWTNRNNGPGNGYDQATAVAVDGSGNVFVTGGDFTTIAYSGAGVPLWTNRYDHNGNDEATAVAVDGSGNVFVTGFSHRSLDDTDYATIAYSGAGVPLWTNRYDGPGPYEDVAIAIAVDGSGNVFVTGYSYLGGGDWSYATVAYSGAGVPLWTNCYNGPGNSYLGANAVAVDASGNVFVTGISATIAYSGAGAPLWTNSVSGTAIALDGSGNVFVTGSGTIAYSGAGVPLWTNSYGGSDLAIGSDGAVYVTGSSLTGGSDGDFATVKYVWQPEIAIQLLATIPPRVNLTLSAAPNSSWAIERALEPNGPWTNLSALLIGTNGSAQFQDTNSPSPAGFYRAVQP